MEMTGALTKLFVAALLLLSVGLAGCGGGGEEFGLMTFDDLPDATPVPVEEFKFALSPKEALLVEVTYVYTHTILLESLQRINRDMQLLLEYEDATEVDLEWVIEVHEVTADAETFFERASNLEVPTSLEDKYSRDLLDFLTAMQWSGFGSDRLLASSLTVGPSGRSLYVMREEEKEVFERFAREAAYYLDIAEKMVEEQIELYMEYAGSMDVPR